MTDPQEKSRWSMSGRKTSPRVPRLSVTTVSWRSLVEKQAPKGHNLLRSLQKLLEQYVTAPADRQFRAVFQNGHPAVLGIQFDAGESVNIENI